MTLVRNPRATVVTHIGVGGDRPGGMAQVVREYLSWTIPGIELRSITSTAGAGDRSSVFRWIAAAARIVRIRMRRTDDHLVFHLSQGGAFIREGSLVALAALLRLPSAIHLHGSQYVPFAEKRPALVRAVCARAKRVLVLTEATRTATISAMGAGVASRVPVVIVPNAVAVPASVPVKSRQLLFAGEVGERKGVDVLVEAWSRVSADIPDWELLVAGPLVEPFSSTPPAVERLRLLGPLPRDEVLALAGSAAIAVLPSRHEALPMFLIEAMARGCAVIATDVGQIASLLENDAGVLIPAGNADSLELAIRDLTSDDVRRAEIAGRGRARVTASFSEAAVAGRLAELWVAR